MHFHLSHGKPHGKAEEKLAKQAKSEGKIGIIAKTEPKVRVESSGDKTTYVWDHDFPAHVSPKAGSPGKWTVEEHYVYNNRTEHGVDVKTYSSKEKADKEAHDYAQKGFPDASLEFRVTKAVTKDVAATVNKIIEKHHSTYEDNADTYSVNIKVLSDDETRTLAMAVSRVLVVPQGRTSKASSAEAILRYCLRKTGLSASYRAGTLSVSDHLRLLEEVRQHGRAWLRREAYGFTRQYMSVEQTAGPGSIDWGVASGVARDSYGDLRERAFDLGGTDYGGVLRAASWVTGPGGYLIQQDVGFRHAAGRFFRRAKQFVRELILSSALAVLGPAPLTGEELDAVDAEVQKQEQFFDRFYQRTVEPPEKPLLTPVDTTSHVITSEPAPLTPGQFIAAAERYADSAWQSAQRLNRVQAVKNPQFSMEMRVLGAPKTEHCADCPPLADLGWQPLGTLPAIGDTECGSLCLCHFRYSSSVPGSPEYFQGKTGVLRAPGEVVMLDDSGDVEMIAEPPGGLAEKFPVAGPA